MTSRRKQQPEPQQLPNAESTSKSTYDAPEGAQYPNLANEPPNGDSQFHSSILSSKQLESMQSQRARRLAMEVQHYQAEPNYIDDGLLHSLLDFTDGKVTIRQDLNTEFTDCFGPRCQKEMRAQNTFCIDPNHPGHMADQLGIGVAGITRDNMTFTKLVSFLIVDPLNPERFFKLVRSPMPRVRTFVEVEKRFRTYWLPQLHEDGKPQRPFSCPTKDASDLEAVLLFVTFVNTARYEIMLTWFKRHALNLCVACRQADFCMLIQSLLRDAKFIATGDDNLLAALSDWPSPLEDCEPFLRHFVSLWAQWHFTWLVAFTACRPRLYDN